jgi:DNA (cytosine-5)-methyltransferase 1|tara:strand:- start:60 stop:674 length:615 start_codon:yes stop_codon:yes gene_type:complete
MKILNLYAGLGGNRWLWKDCEVTAVELEDNIADQYQRFFPEDTLYREDAHVFLEKCDLNAYDMIWSSPPCQTHSKMAISGKNRKPRYTDLSLYEEIMFLQRHYKGRYVVENVAPYYKPFIEPSQSVGRHRFWSNFEFKAVEVAQPNNFINLTTVAGSHKLKQWLGIEYPNNIYYRNNHCPAQVLRNCVHPSIGLQILNHARGKR